MRLKEVDFIRGYSVLNISDNIIYAAKGYKIFKSRDQGVSWELDGSVKDMKYGIISNVSRLLARLFRAEIVSMVILKDNTRVLIGKKAIFLAKPDEKSYQKVFSIARGSRPMNICVDQDENLYFGEYFSNPDRTPVHIYRSVDQGRTWDTCYTFPEQTIRHIHGIFYDKYENSLWFCTGDLDGECIIGNSKDGFKTVEFFKKGGQKYRAVTLLFFQDYIMYGTDTELEKNYIYRIDRKDGKEHLLQEIQGSVLSATNSDNIALISTAVEPSEINRDNNAHIWYTKNGKEWKELYQCVKDKYDFNFFQFGRFKFPIGAVQNRKIYFTGHALDNLDNTTVVYPMETISNQLNNEGEGYNV